MSPAGARSSKTNWKTKRQVRLTLTGKVQQSCVRCGNSDKNTKCLRWEAVPMVVWCKVRDAPAIASVRRHVPGLFLRKKLDDPMAKLL